MAISRIAGQMLSSNLLRDGVDLAIDTDLLYVDVTNGKIGVKTAAPTAELEINGTVLANNITATHTVTGTSFVGRVAATMSTVEPLNPASGMLWWDTENNLLTVYNAQQNRWKVAGLRIVRYEFTNSLTWTINHNMGTTRFRETLTGADNKRFYALVNIIDENSFEVRLTEATSGAVDVIFD